MDTDEVIVNVLTHHGVKGMHWGVRRGRSASVSGSGSESHHTKSMKNQKETAGNSEDHEKASATKEKIKAGGTKKVGNAELQHLVNRMNLEQQYSSLSGKSETSKGKKFANSLLSDSKDVARQSVKQAAAKVIAKQIGVALAKTALG